jgi:hypothetical protein
VVRLEKQLIWINIGDLFLSIDRERRWDESVFDKRTCLYLMRRFVLAKRIQWSMSSSWNVEGELNIKKTEPIGLFIISEWTCSITGDLAMGRMYEINTNLVQRALVVSMGFLSFVHYNMSVSFGWRNLSVQRKNVPCGDDVAGAKFAALVLLIDFLSRHLATSPSTIHGLLFTVSNPQWKMPLRYK